MLVKQSKSVSWLGAFQVQIMNSMFYLNLISMGMTILTFWYTAGFQIRDNFIPWFSLWLFVIVVAILFLFVMFLDYKYILPSRQAFTNEQSCKHENPAMTAILDIQKRLARIENKLGIED